MAMDGLRLNIGCGFRIKDGYYNIDAIHSPKAPRAPDLLYKFEFDDKGELIQPIPLPDGCAVEILAIHFFEHLYRWQCDAVAKEFKRLLRPNGKLILELPDLYKCCLNVVENRQGKKPDQLQRWGIYGDPTLKSVFMCHPWGWFAGELMEFLAKHGFKDLQHVPTEHHQSGRNYRDMRIEARKP